MDWSSVFSLETPLLEIILRGSIMYLTVFALLRIVLKRQTGALGMTDLLLITLLADASQNGLAGDYESIADGLVLVCTIIFWNYVLDWLSFRSEWFGRLLEPAPVPLVRRGKMLRNNMRREFIREEELMMELRKQGLEDVSRVKAAYMEADGQISTIQYE